MPIMSNRSLSNQRLSDEVYREALSYNKADLVEAVRVFREADGNSPGSRSGTVTIGTHVTTWAHVINIDIPRNHINGMESGATWKEFLASQGWEPRKCGGRGKSLPETDAAYLEQIIIDYFESSGRKFWPQENSGPVMLLGRKTNWASVRWLFVRGKVKGAEQVKSLKEFVGLVQEKYWAARAEPRLVEDAQPRTAEEVLGIVRKFLAAGGKRSDLVSKATRLDEQTTVGDLTASFNAGLVSGAEDYSRFSSYLAATLFTEEEDDAPAVRPPA
jgi:hypothetical protein